MVIKSTCLYIIESSQDRRKSVAYDIIEMEKCRFANSCCWINYRFYYFPWDMSSVNSNLQEELRNHIRGYKFNLIKQISSAQISADLKQKEKANKLFQRIVNPDSNWKYSLLWQHPEKFSLRQQIYKWTEVYKYLLASVFKEVIDYAVIDSILGTEYTYKLPGKMNLYIDSLSYALYWYSLLNDKIEEYEQVKTEEKSRDNWFYLEGGYKVRNVNVRDWSLTQDDEEVPFIKITGEIKRTTGSYGYRSFTLGLHDWNYRIIKVEKISLTIPKTSATVFEVDVYGRITSDQVLGIRMYSAE